MKNKDVYAVLLAGGKGTRLWPLSTENRSKSFAHIGSRKPLVTETIQRLQGLIDKRNIVIVVDKVQEKILRRFTGGIPKQNILVEPFGRSTASAVGLAAIELDPGDTMVILPTDALIKESNSFRKTIKSAIDFVCKKDGALLCIGIKPKEPTSAYGYIKLKARQEREIYSVDKFIEKPKESVAARLIKKEDCLWNAGMFVFRAKDILSAMRRYAPGLYRELQRIKRAKRNKQAAYSRMRNVSIDYQIMEKAKDLYCVKGNFSWCDLGNWASLKELFKKDKKGNICFGKATLMNTRDSIVYNSTRDKLGVVGLEDVAVVHTDEGVLVCSKKDAEKVKALVCRL